MLRDVKGAAPEVVELPHHYHFGTHSRAARRETRRVCGGGTVRLAVWAPNRPEPAARGPVARCWDNWFCRFSLTS